MRSVHTAAYKAFLVRLVLARAKTGLTQGAVARQLGMPQSRLSRMESGERRVDVIELSEIAALYGRSISFFIPAVSGRRSVPAARIRRS